jgi:hypothetical protein
MQDRVLDGRRCKRRFALGCGANSGSEAAPLLMRKGSGLLIWCARGNLVTVEVRAHRQSQDHPQAGAYGSGLHRGPGGRGDPPRQCQSRYTTASIVDADSHQFEQGLRCCLAEYVYKLTVEFHR